MPATKDRNAKVTKLEYTFKGDVLFRNVACKTPSLVAALLDMLLTNIAKFDVLNTDMLPEESR